jgi:prepilin-type N-terminal cleavage/methylation domain-containing protein/uncharacterized repeat protein (TIGR02543 family)
MNEKIKRTFNRKGMTLVELLMVILILAILGSLVTVAALKHRRNLKLYEMDNTAKEIFVTAQNHLSVMKVEGLLPDSDTVTDTAWDLVYDGTSVSVITGDGTAADDKAQEAWEELLPYGAIDETVRVDGSYIISFDPVNAIVRDVFYSDAYTFSSTKDLVTSSGTVAYSDELTKAKDDEDTRKRFNNTNDVIGYYGGADADTVSVESFHEPEITVINGDQLKVEVALNEADAERSDVGSAQLIVTIGNKKKVLAGRFPLTATIDKSGKKSTRTCTFILDDVTADGSSASDTLRFTDIFKQILGASDSTYQLGEDISIQAVVLPENATLDETGTKIVSSGWSEEQTVNPLFAGIEDNTARISSFRHLINLQTLNDYGKDSGTSVQKLSVTSAKQTSDIDWSSFVEEGNVHNSDYSYAPLSLDNDFTYDGHYYRIANLKIGSADGTTADDSTLAAAGLFGSVSHHLTLNNMVLDDFDVYGTNAGALAGEVTDGGQLTVRAVLARTYDNSRRIHGTENAGGLIGSIAGDAGTDTSEISLSSASVYVEGGTNAGGMIGYAVNTTIKDCYTAGHTKDGEYIQDTSGDDVRINVQATDESGIAGGLVGSFSGSGSSISASYSTASVYGSLAGTLIGSSADTQIDDGTVYGSGLALDSNKQQVTALVGNVSAIGGYDYRSFVQGNRISYRYDAIDNGEGTKTTIIGFALPGVQDLDSDLQQDDADTVPFFIRNHFGDWKILDQIQEKQIYYVDFYTYDSDGNLVPYTADPMVNFVRPDLNINRQGVVEGESVYIPKEAPEGKYIESIDFYLTDTALDNPDAESFDSNSKNTYDPNQAEGQQYTYADDNSGTDKTDFSNVNKNIIAIVNLQATDEISGRVQLKASFFDTSDTGTTYTDTHAIAYPRVVDGKVTPVQPVYAGYDFKGWYSDETCTSSVTVDDDGKIAVGEMKTLYARYEQKTSTTKTVAFVLEVQGLNGAKNTSLGTMLAHTDSNTLGEVKLRNYKNIQPTELYRWDGSDWTKVENPAFNTDTATLTLDDDLSSAASYAAASADAAYKIVYTGDMVSYKVQYIFQNTDGSGLNASDFYHSSSDGTSYEMTQSVDKLPYSSNDGDTFVIETEEATVKGMLATAKPLNFMDGDQNKFTQSEIDGNNVVLDETDGDHTIKVYYTRKSYYLTYDFQSGIYNYTDSDGNAVRAGMKASEPHMYGETFDLLNDDSTNTAGYVQKKGYVLADGQEWYLIPDQSDDASKSYASLSADANYPANLEASSLRSAAGFTMPAENVHVVANWQENETAPVTVEIFRQNVDHSKTDLYDYYTSFSNVGSFSTASDQSIQLSDVFAAISGETDAPTSSARFRTGDPDQGNYPSYDYYDFNLSKTTESLPGEVSPDGSTVIRLYYDREKINFVFDYSAIGGVQISEETEATVSPVTIYQLTRTPTETTQDYQYLQQGTDGTDLRCIANQVYYYNGVYYSNRTWSFWGYRYSNPVDAAYVVKYNNNQYELVDSSTDTGSGNFYYAPVVTSSSYTGYYQYTSNGRTQYVRSDQVYSVVSGQRTVTSYTYSWDNGTTYSPVYGTDSWNYDSYGNKSYFGHSLNDDPNDNVYYFTSNVRNQMTSDAMIEQYLSSGQNTDHVGFSMPDNAVDWSAGEPHKLVYPAGSTVDKITWTGLYEEPVANYASYSWPEAYSWRYIYPSNNQGGSYITFLAQFLPDANYVDGTNTITMRGSSNLGSGLTISHYLQSDFTPLTDSDLQSSSAAASHFDDSSPQITQTTSAGSFQLTNKYLGYSVCAYDYKYGDYYWQETFNTGGTGTTVQTSRGGTLKIYHKRNTYQIRVENTGADSAPEFDELYEQQIASLDVSEFKENPPSDLGTGYIFTGLYNSRGADATQVFDANGNFVGDETTYGVDTDGDGTVDAFQMPANNVQLFAHWEAPKVKVFFNLSGSEDDLKDLDACEAAVEEAGDSVQLVDSDTNLYKVTDDLYYVEMPQDTATLDTAVKAVQSLTENLTMTDSDGNTYEFGEWSTAKDSLQEYIASSAVIDDYVLYPHWNQTAGTVRIQINVVGADGSSLIGDLDKTGWEEDTDIGIWTKDNWEFDSNQNALYWKGTMHTSGVIEAPEIHGYTPYVSSQTINDISPVSDAITFTYTSSQNVWTYQVNYVADFGNGIKLTIKSETRSSENASEIVTTDLNLNGYYLEGVLGDDGSTVDPSAYTILTRTTDSGSSVPTVTFVYEVMTDEVFSLTGSSKLFDGTSCPAKVTYIGESNDLFAGFTKRTVLEYSEDGTNWTADAPVYAGRYQVRASVIFKDKNGLEYTVWTETSDSSDQYVNIIRRSVFLESASYVFEQQDDQTVYRDTTVRVSGDGFLSGDGVEIQNSTAVPKGTSSTTPNNYFTYSFLTSDSKTQAYYERNYNIQRIFGTLRVQTELSDADREVNAQWGTPGAEQRYSLY